MARRLSHMGSNETKKLGTRRRKLLTQRLREYFDEIRALEGDSEAFFRNAMARAEHTPAGPHAPQNRRG